MYKPQRRCHLVHAQTPTCACGFRVYTCWHDIHTQCRLTMSPAPLGSSLHCVRILCHYIVETGPCFCKKNCYNNNVIIIYIKLWAQLSANISRKSSFIIISVSIQRAPYMIMSVTSVVSITHHFKYNQKLSLPTIYIATDGECDFIANIYMPFR